MQSPPQSPLLAALGLDLESSLGGEPRFLMDARFLGALHGELDQELGPEEAFGALLQMGFVHGLRDAADVTTAEAEAEAQQGAGEDGTTPPAGTTLRPGAQAALAIQLSEIDSEIAILEGQKVAIEEEIGVLDETIERTPEVAIALSEMERAQEILIRQYTAAEDRLAKAQTGELIESRSRGQRISVIEQPNIPDDPTKPNRVKIAGAGGALGIMAGLGLVMLLEFLNTSVRRPEDLVSRLGVTPFTTIPYIRTRSQQFRQRSLKALMLLAIVVGIPAAVYAVHIYYLPIDLVADKVMDKLGVRW